MIDHHIKSGRGAASIRGLRPEMAVAVSLLIPLFTRHKLALRISSGTEGKHSRGSLHYVGQAIDVSFRGIPQKILDFLHAEMKAVLGDEFDVVKETTHFHVEFQPKKPLNTE